MASLSLDRATSPDDTLMAVAEVLGASLGLSAEVTVSLDADTLLFGNLPELDSMAVATVLTALEDRFHILIDDDEVSGELFETVGSLAAFIRAKRPRA